MHTKMIITISIMATTQCLKTKITSRVFTNIIITKSRIKGITQIIVN